MQDNCVNVLAIGDIVGESGRKVLRKYLKEVRNDLKVDFCVANGENAAGGAGLTPLICEELFSYGVDVITGGDHVFDKKEIYPYIQENNKVLRPANLPEEAFGTGYTVVEIPKGSIAILHLCGRVFMKPQFACPFATFDRIFMVLSQITPYIIVDYHAEATAEKVAFGYYVDGRASLVFGTHTHIPTADEKILPQGCGYITDVGMTGPYNSVIGREINDVLEAFKTGMPKRFEVAKGGGAALSAVYSKIDSQTGKCSHIRRIFIEDDNI
jgi:2',3'-cyclic-nucleotide 2'-phosphodiesterase